MSATPESDSIAVEIDDTMADALEAIESLEKWYVDLVSSEADWDEYGVIDVVIPHHVWEEEGHLHRNVEIHRYHRIGPPPEDMYPDSRVYRLTRPLVMWNDAWDLIYWEVPPVEALE